jgi:hypothetical protein
VGFREVRFRRLAIMSESCDSLFGGDVESAAAGKLEREPVVCERTGLESALAGPTIGNEPLPGLVGEVG